MVWVTYSTFSSWELSFGDDQWSRYAEKVHISRRFGWLAQNRFLSRVLSLKKCVVELMFTFLLYYIQKKKKIGVVWRILLIQLMQSRKYGVSSAFCTCFDKRCNTIRTRLISSLYR
jgi:hypothetical protein